MSIIGVQLSFDEFFIIIFNVSYLCHFEQVVTAVHFNTQGVERIDYFSGLGDDRFFFIREFGQEMFFYDRIDTIRLVRDGSAQSYRQSVFGFLEFLGSDDTAHGDYLRILVRHFDTDRSCSGNRGDDPDAQSRKAKRYVVLKVFDFGNLDTRSRYDLIQGDGRTDGCFDLGDFDFVITQRFYNPVFVSIQFFLGDFRITGGMLFEEF